MTEWTTSDWHCYHPNIHLYETSRPDNDEEVMFANWARLVQPEDTVYFLGDLVLTGSPGRKKVELAMREMPGRKVFVRGNHDKKLSDAYLAACGFEEVHQLYLHLPERRMLLSHYPLTNVDQRYLDRIAELNRVFDELGCLIQVHGHTHHAWSRDARCVNVSVEVAGFRPVTLDEVVEMGRRRANEDIDKPIVFPTPGAEMFQSR